jgi:aspartyl-tRNA(Asn)/glutamyl-tRNA(Gln) amidotransferase subunit C
MSLPSACMARGNTQPPASARSGPLSASTDSPPIRSKEKQVMGITIDEVSKIALLARLDIAEEQAGLFAAQMGTILAYMDTLNELDTSAVEPMYSPVDHVSVLREDEVHQTTSRDEILENAPEEDGRYFVVPKIV